MKQTFAAFGLAAMTAVGAPSTSQAANHMAPQARALEESGQGPYIIGLLEETPEENRSEKFEAAISKMTGICEELGYSSLTECVENLPKEAPEGIILAGKEDPHYEYTHPFFTEVLTALHEVQKNGGSYGEYIKIISENICGTIPNPESMGPKFDDVIADGPGV